MRIFPTLICAALAMTVTAQDFSTPEAAFREHQSAWARKNVDEYVATIAFREEVIESLKSATNSRLPDEEALQKLALERENQLRVYLKTRGWIPDTLTGCKIITKWQVTEDVIRFPLACDAPNGSLAYAIRLVRLAQGWRVVRNG
jgi:hypothetical protein